MTGNNGIEVDNLSGTEMIINVLATYLKQYRDMSHLRPMFDPISLDIQVRHYKEKGDAIFFDDGTYYESKVSCSPSTPIILGTSPFVTAAQNDMLYEEKFIIPECLANYMLTHVIKDEYKNIPFYRNNIDNVFKRAIWEVCITIAHKQGNKIVFDPDEYHKFLHMVDAFALLSRPMDQEDFEYRYKKSIYNYIKKKVPKDINIKDLVIPVPDHIFNHYSKIRYPDILPRSSLVRNRYPSDMFFDKLCNYFKRGVVTVGSISSTVDNKDKWNRWSRQSENTKERNYNNTPEQSFTVRGNTVQEKSEEKQDDGQENDYCGSYKSDTQFTSGSIDGFKLDSTLNENVLDNNSSSRVLGQGMYQNNEGEGIVGKGTVISTILC